ncbi:MAG: HD domain-containing protein [bacterium]|nr:HD domain-containing protein [bacterium]
MKKDISPKEDRREILPEINDVGTYSQGIKRVENRATSDLLGHDTFWKDAEKGKWLTEYSLYEHSLKLANIMFAVSEARGRDERSIMVGSVAALLHDMGKLDETCNVYRLNRVLTPEERVLINRHAEFSAHYVLKRMSDVRPSDRAFLMDVYPIVRYHHQPWLISDPYLREIGSDLNLVDVFGSLIENRHRPGLSQFRAVDAVEEIIHKQENNWRKMGNWPEVQASHQAIARLYGTPKNIVLP